MKTPTLILAGLFALGLAGCTQATTPLQSGGSGASDDRMLGTASFYGEISPYDTPGKAPGCAPLDANCAIIYNAPGGGD